MKGKASFIQKESKDTANTTAGCYLLKFPICIFSLSVIYSMQPMQLLIYKPDKQNPCLREHIIKQQNIWCS